MFLPRVALLVSAILPALAQVYVPEATDATPTMDPRPTGLGIVTSLPTPDLPPGPPDTYGAGASIPQYGAWYSYPQPPIPTQTASAPEFRPTLGPHTPPCRREYTLHVDYSAGSPDGFLRSLKTINGQFPGPAVEAVQGDTLVVHVHNHLHEPTTIHWHGIHHNTTQYMDGVPGFSQCPIPPGGSFTYEFPIEGELGTYWYHAHFGNTMADGIFGALLIHAPCDPLIDQSDDDQVLFVADYWEDDSEEVVKASKMDGVGYRGCEPVDVPDAVIINGVGQVDCRMVQRGVPCNTDVPPYELRAKPGQRLRLRLIAHGSHSIMFVSIDQHKMFIVEADSTAVEPVEITELRVGPGERYSVIVELNEGSAGDAFWIRTRAATGCYNGKWRVDGLAVLRYHDEKSVDPNATLALPNSTQWEGLADLSKRTPGLCEDMDNIGYDLVPLLPIDPPAVADESFVFTSQGGPFVDPVTGKYFGWGFNNVSFVNYVNDPLLKQVNDGKWLNSKNVASATFTGSSAADIVINQRDGPPHPFHLHGRPFSNVARGTGVLNSTEGIELNLTNPLRRDTLLIGPESWVILRLPLDNPGVWPLHCHLDWHLSVGKMAAVVVRPDLVQQFHQPEAVGALCTGDPGEIGPGRRRSYVPPQIGAKAS